MNFTNARHRKGIKLTREQIKIYISTNAKLNFNAFSPQTEYSTDVHGPWHSGLHISGDISSLLLPYKLLLDDGWRWVTREASLADTTQKSTKI